MGSVLGRSAPRAEVDDPQQQRDAQEDADGHHAVGVCIVEDRERVAPAVLLAIDRRVNSESPIAVPTAMPTRWPSWPTEPARPPSRVGISARVSVWFGATTKPAPAPARTMTPAMAYSTTPAGTVYATIARATTLTSTTISPPTTRGRPSRATSEPPNHAVMALATAKQMDTMPAKTGSVPMPICRNSVVSRNIAGMAVK